MLSGAWLVVAVLAAILLTWWITFTLTRIGRLYARTEAAWATLDAQLVRRAAALALVGESHSPPGSPADALRAREVSQRALSAAQQQRQAAENDVSRAIARLVGSPASAPALSGAAGAELAEASVRAAIARRFYNDAARDTRALLARRMPRYLHLARGRELPQFFDIEDAPRWPAALGAAPAREPAEITTEESDDDPTLLEATDRA